MERFIEFSINHWQLVLIFVSLLSILIWHESKKGGRTITPQILVNLVNKSQALVLDLRDAKEFRDGHITGATNLPYIDASKRMGELEAHKDKPVILVCKMGQHSSAVGKLLHKAGFTQVLRLSGGIGAWQAQNLPLVNNGKAKS